METWSIKEFRKKHNCKSCLYYKKMKSCEGLLVCPLEIETKEQKKSCPLDEEGTCPYKNEAGTCFGFCIRKLLQEERKSK